MDPFRPSQGYRQLDHTADLAIEFWAPSEEGLLVVGGLALVELMTDEYEADPDAETAAEHNVKIDAVDAADRLVRFLNEVLVAAVTDRFLLASADVKLSGEGGLHAAMRGEAVTPETLVTELESVTYHDLELTHHDYGWYARVVIDV